MNPAEVRLVEYFTERANAGHRLYQFMRYALEVYGLGRLLTKLTDRRRDPEVKTLRVTLSLMLAAVMRVPSLNELEWMLRQGEFQRLLGEKVKKRQGKALFSADTIADVLDTLEIMTLQLALVELIKQAERNKAFRDDTFGTFICVAIDGWEPFSTYVRHCEACLTRMVKRKEKIAAARRREDDVTLSDKDLSGDPEERVLQYYHRFVVAFLIAPKLDLTLAIEPVRTEAERIKAGEPVGCGHEGEQTAALRLIDRLHQSYGCFIDAFALDGLYPNGPVFEKLTAYNYGAVISCRDNGKDPYRFAEAIWQARPQPDAVLEDPESKEQVRYWRLNGVDALASFAGSVDMLKAEVTKFPRLQDPTKKPHKNTRGCGINIKRHREPETHTWVMALVGKAKRLGTLQALRVMRARWHIENTAFHQWTTKWNLDHCYRHSPNAIVAVLHLWAFAFNLMQLFFYRRLGKPRRGRNVNDTMQALVKGMYAQAMGIAEPVPWEALIQPTLARPDTG